MGAPYRVSIAYGRQGPSVEKAEDAVGEPMRQQPVVDFDHHSREYLDDRLAEWRRLRQTPVAFSPRYGGFWVVSGHAAVAEVVRDEDTFTSQYGERDGVTYGGIAGVPRIRGIPPAGIAEADPAVHQSLRRL